MYPTSAVLILALGCAGMGAGTVWGAGDCWWKSVKLFNLLEDRRRHVQMKLLCAGTKRGAGKSKVLAGQT
eukprot:47075-Pelagomonas_calceolata.AAC.4